jgi:uncharacterized protein (DUF3820 family)
MSNSANDRAHTQPPTTSAFMPFGKFKGLPLAELSNDYLLWLGRLETLRQPLLGHVLLEMGRQLAASEVQP